MNREITNLIYGNSAYVYIKFGKDKKDYYFCSIIYIDLANTHNMAKNNLSVVETSARQNEQSIEEEVIMTVNDFNVQGGIIQSAEEARKLAESAYEDTRARFIIGQSDINSLSMALNRKDAAQKNYIAALRNYWLSYYKIRRLTLFDFEKGKEIK